MKEKIKSIIESNIKDLPVRKSADGPLAGKDLFVFKESKVTGKSDGYLYYPDATRDDEKRIVAEKIDTVVGYVPRLAFIITQNAFIVRDYRDGRSLKKSFHKINDSFVKKLASVFESKASADSIHALFDRKDTIDELYQLYRKTRDYIIDNLKGQEEEKIREYVENYMLTMLTLWFLQMRGFFNDDTNYFINKFREFSEGDLFKSKKGGFHSFLKKLFDEISGHDSRAFIDSPEFGKVAVLGPALFLEMESRDSVHIPDECFYKPGFTETLIQTKPKNLPAEVPLFNMLESREWAEGNYEGNIDEFVLGAIYEKLINTDERKKTGAYYTPPEITEYMAEATIRPFLLSRFNEVTGSTHESLRAAIENADKKDLLSFYKILKEIRICDPAVGSAHFLEDAIEELVKIYNEVRIRAKDLGMKKGFEIIHVDNSGELSKLDLLELSTTEDRFHLAVKFFIILSKNIYGVDIDERALKVGRARLFLTLAKHFKSQSGAFLRFPNVHFNLRKGNSLVGFLRTQAGNLKKPADTQLGLFTFTKPEATVFHKILSDKLAPISAHVTKTAKALDLGLNLNTDISDLDRVAAGREIIEDDFALILSVKERLVRVLIASLPTEVARPIVELLDKINEIFYSKLNQRFAEVVGQSKDNVSELTPFHWDFEFPEVFGNDGGGFDVILGNPPYNILSEKEGGNTDLFLMSYVRSASSFSDFLEGKINLYHLFIRRALDLFQEKGYMSYIIPFSYLADIQSSKLRKHILSNHSYIFLHGFPLKDNPNKRVFFDAKQAACIIGISHEVVNKDFPVSFHAGSLKKEDDLLLQGLQSSVAINEWDKEKVSFPIGDKHDILLFSRIRENSSYKLSDIATFYQGEINEATDKGNLTEDTSYPLVLRGSNITLYSVRDPSQGTQYYLNTDRLNRRGGKLLHANEERVGLQRSSPMENFRRLIAACIPSGHYCLDTIEYAPSSESKLSSDLLLGFLNSDLFEYLFRVISSNSKINEYQLNSLPFPDLKKHKDSANRIDSDVKAIIKIENARVVTTKKERAYLSEESQKLQDRINQEVYKIYGITETERGRIETRILNNIKNKSDYSDVAVEETESVEDGNDD
jgi:hypothetical protein